MYLFSLRIFAMFVRSTNDSDVQSAGDDPAQWTVFVTRTVYSQIAYNHKG